MQSVVVKGVVEKIKEWLENELNELWEIRTGDDYIELQYEDAYEIERVWIHAWVNEYGVIWYRLETEYADVDEEIYNCCSCHHPFCEDCPLAEELSNEDGDIDDSKLDEYIDNEVRKHLSIKPIRVHRWDELTIRPAIVERACYLDVPHTHIYKGVSLTFETQDIEKFKAVFVIRDVLYSLITR